MFPSLKQFSPSASLNVASRVHKLARMLAFSSKSQSQKELIDGLLQLEGRLRGKEAREKTMRPEEQRSLLQRLEGRGAISQKEIQSAYLHFRPSYLQGLSEGLGLPYDSVKWHRRHRSIQEKTKLCAHEGLSAELQRPIFLKDEGRLPGGSIHYLGNLHLLTLALEAGIDPAKIQLITVSMGHHALALAKAAQDLGFSNPVMVFAPKDTPHEKRKRLEKADHLELISSLCGFLETQTNAQKLADKHPGKYFYAPPMDHYEKIVGMGTIGVEIEQSLSQSMDQYGVLISTKNPAAFAGVSAYLAPKGIQVLGVESWLHPTLSQAFNFKRSSRLGEVEEQKILTNGLADLNVEESPFHVIFENASDILVISGCEMDAASAYLSKKHGISVSPHESASVAALLFGGIKKTYSDRLRDNLPLVIIFGSGNQQQGLKREFDGYLSQGVAWQIGIMVRLYVSLDQRGLLDNNTLPKTLSVKTLHTVGEAIDLIDILMEMLPIGWDLLDFLAHIHFGPYRDEGDKDMSASLRSFGMFCERWNGCKGESLYHPLTGRGAVLMGYLQMLEEIKRMPSRLRKDRLKKQEREQSIEKHFKRMHPRVVIESYVIDLFLQREDWVMKLWPNLSEEKRQERIAQLKDLNDKVKLAVRTLSLHFFSNNSFSKETKGEV